MGFRRLTDLNDALPISMTLEGDRELKAWDAIARYMQSFEDTDGDGIANVR